MSNTEKDTEVRLIPIQFEDDIVPGDSIADKLLEAVHRSRNHRAVS